MFVLSDGKNRRRLLDEVVAWPVRAHAHACVFIRDVRVMYIKSVFVSTSVKYAKCTLVGGMHRHCPPGDAT